MLTTVLKTAQSKILKVFAFQALLCTFTLRGGLQNHNVSGYRLVLRMVPGSSNMTRSRLCYDGRQTRYCLLILLLVAFFFLIQPVYFSINISDYS